MLLQLLICLVVVVVRPLPRGLFHLHLAVAQLLSPAWLHCQQRRHHHST
jgi:hypothetical protein